MKLIWTRNKRPLSKMIRWATREPVSHFAVVFDDKLVLESNLLGVHLGWFNTFLKHQEIVYTIEADLPLTQEEEVYRAILDQFDGKPYDYRALLYFGWRMVLHRLFNTPLPRMNRWGRPGSFLCSEIACVLPYWLLGHHVDLDEMVTPYGLFKKFIPSRGDG